MSIKDLLIDLGYKLTDCGTVWRAQAIYRSGKNSMSLMIDKKDGAYYDFGTGEAGNFQTLIELSTGNKIENFEDFLEAAKIEINFAEPEKPTIEMEKIWQENELELILPHYKFYEDRGISKETLRFFRSGLQHSGTLNQRYVFPIYNELGQIHGWSGRDMTNKKKAKWYHVGRTSNWVYPFYMENESGDFPSQDSIREGREIILLESIGDMLALWERGYRNTLVAFGVKLSPKLCSTIMGLAPKRVTIAFNNDSHKDFNTGREKAISAYMKLINYVDYNKISIALPYKANDFGEINDDNFKVWEERYRNPNFAAIKSAVIESREKILKSGKKVSSLKNKVWKPLIEEHAG